MEISGKEAVVVGVSEDGGGRWLAVDVAGTTWMIREGEVVATGRKISRDRYYSGDAVKVLVDPDTGEGIPK